MDDFVKKAYESMENPSHQRDIIASITTDKEFGFTVIKYSVRIGNVDEMPNVGFHRCGVTKRVIRGSEFKIAIDRKKEGEEQDDWSVMQLRTIANKIASYCNRNAYDGLGLFDD